MFQSQKDIPVRISFTADFDTSYSATESIFTEELLNFESLNVFYSWYILQYSKLRHFSKMRFCHENNPDKMTVLTGYAHLQVYPIILFGIVDSFLESLI